MRTVLKTGLIFFLLFTDSRFSLSQSYTSYFTGDTSNVTTITEGGTVLMGGATENDNAMIWFLQHSGGGDIVVIRASGSSGYNTYLYSSLGIPVNSVETIVFNNATASYDPYVINQIRNAEALWIAGGDQWDYVSYWKNSPIDTAINYLINDKKIPVGGTSAGMAVLGAIVFTAQNGSVTSATALNNPFDTDVTLLKDSFLFTPFLDNVITDTHYDSPDRKGRHVTFMARIFQDYGVPANGIASEEYTAVCIDTNGIAHVYGDYPANEDYAYFLQPNCVLPNSPENCAPAQSLNWNRTNEAVKVYKVAGTQNGLNTFDLNDWLTGSGGRWQNWYVTSGVLNVDTSAIPPGCPASINDTDLNLSQEIKVYPNPFENQITISIAEKILPQKIIIFNCLGEKLIEKEFASPLNQLTISEWKSGIYFLQVTDLNTSSVLKIIKK
ncbi:MAG: T9SS type A sorting domain-containing protein [Bacteroidota bacterium]|nr:T9SS type A sorting domain-containing protein [Bacteroidota bacterium]